MKTAYLSCLALALSLCMSASSMADIWTDKGHVTAVMQFDNGNIHFWTDFPRGDISGCGGDRYVIAAANTTIKQNYASLIVALNSQRLIRVYIIPGCLDGNPIVRVIEFS